MSENRFEDLRDDFLQRCYFRMKQIEREWKAAQDDATDDEVGSVPVPSLINLTMSRTTSCRRLTLMIQLRVLMPDSAPSLHRVVEHTLRLTESLKKMSGESCSMRFALPLSTRIRTQMTRSKISLAASLDLLDLTAQKQLRTTTSPILQTLHMMLRGHHRHRSSCQKLKSFPTIKQPCSCSLRICQWHSLPMTLASLFQANRTKKYLSLCRPHRLLLDSTSLGSYRQYPLQVYHWRYHHKRLIVVQSGHHRLS